MPIQKTEKSSRMKSKVLYINHIKTFTRTLISQSLEGDDLELGSGGAFFTGLHSPFSQVIGWGFEKGDAFLLGAIEDFY